MYPAQKWVCTTEIEDDEEEQNKDAFMRLFGYITGENEGGKKGEVRSPHSPAGKIQMKVCNYVCFENGKCIGVEQNVLNA